MHYILLTNIEHIKNISYSHAIELFISALGYS